MARNNDDIELNPNRVKELQRCDLCNKINCKCEELPETKILGIGFTK
jgi:hypothetical protein